MAHQLFSNEEEKKACEMLLERKADVLHIIKLLRLLQLFCEGHHINFQNYLRLQVSLRASIRPWVRPFALVPPSSPVGMGLIFFLGGFVHSFSHTHAHTEPCTPKSPFLCMLPFLRCRVTPSAFACICVVVGAWYQGTSLDGTCACHCCRSVIVLLAQ